MSNDFTALRARARERRDKIINQAKADYEAALKQIAALEQDLLGVRRLRKSNGTTPAIYVRGGVELPEAPWGDMTLREVVAKTLTRPDEQDRTAGRHCGIGPPHQHEAGLFAKRRREILRRGGYRCEGET